MVTTNIREIYSFTQKDIVVVVGERRAESHLVWYISALYFDLDGSNNLWLSFNLQPFWTKLNICVDDDADVDVHGNCYNFWAVTLFSLFSLFIPLLLLFFIWYFTQFFFNLVSMMAFGHCVMHSAFRPLYLEI